MSATENVATEVSVRRNGGLAALVGALASAVAIAWLGRASDTGAVLDWALFAASAAMGGYWLAQFFDARTPLLVADDQGVRLRLGKAWTGLPWTELAEVEHTPRAGLWRDGRLVFNGASLAEVAREVSRYRAQPLRVGSPEVAKMRLTSVFRVDDTNALLMALPHLLPVKVRTLADGSSEIILR